MRDGSGFLATTVVCALLSMHGGSAALGQEEAVVPVRGTAGLVRVPFRADNHGSEPMECGIAAAHWYSVDLGTAPAGGTVAHDFWASPDTGEVFTLNAKQDRMPVQSLWCGLAGRSWATRSAVTLERHAGSAPSPIALACSASADRLACR